MNPYAFVLSLVLAFTSFQTPETHSPTTQKSCTPGVSFWKLLDEVRVGYMDGRLALGRIYAVCLPRDPMIYIVDYLSGGHYTSWWIKRE